MSETPSYIKSLVKPTGTKQTSRRVWGIDLPAVWIPLFLATNATGDTQLAPASLGCPIRMGYNADGSVKFSKTGRVVTKVDKELADSIRIVKDNFTAGLVSHTEKVQVSNKAAYQRQVEMAIKAGKPIIARDRENLDNAMAKAMAQAIAEAEAEAEAPPEPAPKDKARELVTA